MKLFRKTIKRCIFDEELSKGNLFFETFKGHSQNKAILDKSLQERV